MHKGPFFGRFSLNAGVYPEIGKKLPKMGGSPPKVIIEVGMTASFGNWKRVPF